MSESGIIYEKEGTKFCHACRYRNTPSLLKRLAFGTSLDTCSCWTHKPEERRKILQDGKAVGYYCNERNENHNCKDFKRRR